MAGPPFGSQVRERRRSLDLTQEELARRVGCAAITIRKLEAGALRPSQQVAERLAVALGVPAEARAAFVRAGRQVTPEAKQSSLPLDDRDPARGALVAADLSGRAIRGYQLCEQLGAGGFGAVYRAVQPVVEREVAVKIILPQYADHPEFVRRFEAEARVVARLEHPHIVPLYDYWREPGAAYLVMRLLRGGALGGLLQRGPPPLDATLGLVEQIGAALHVAHRAGVVHRDLKPANVLLDEDGNAYVADFGIAKDLAYPASERTLNGAFIGSPAYSSPEQIRAEPVSPQTDIYALGLLLYELLTGARPFAGPTAAAYIQQHLSAPVPPLSAGRPGLSAPLDRIIQRATAKVAAARYADVRELVGELRRALASPAPAPAPQRPAPAPAPPTLVLDLDEADNPFKGLRPFDEADAADFFGREALVQQLLARLGEEGELSRFLAVVGPSGSGKSSAVRAGLIPALRGGGLPGSDAWYVVDMLPGARPLHELAGALARVAPAGVEPETLLALLRADDRGLLRSARLVLPPGESELVVAIDQFEELFTLAGDPGERERLLEAIVTAVLDEGSRVRVVVTLRADFIGGPLQYVDFGELIRQRSELVLPLTPDELERAIAGPARRAGLALEEGLVARIVADAGGQPGVLPLLQHALSELYAGRRGRALTLAAYRAIGGVAGALARSAEATYEGLGPEARAAARQLFLRLVTPGEGAEDTRRRARRRELEATGPRLAVEQAIDAFARARLLTLDHDPALREPTVEVAHEALLREWPRLRGWVDAAREDLRTQRRLARSAAEWVASGHEPGFLASGARLGQFAALAESDLLSLGPDERAYLDASLAALAAQERAEGERVARELAQARALAEEQRARAEEQAAAGRRLRRGAAVLAVVSLLAVAAAGFAAQQQGLARAGERRAAAQAATAVAAQAESEAERDRATREARLARARALAASALSTLEVDPERSLVLALEAAAATYDADATITAEAEHALQRAVQTSRVRRTLLGHGAVVRTLAVSPDGAMLASGDDSGLLIVWDLASGEERLRLDLFDSLHSLSFSPDGSRLAVMVGNSLHLYDLGAGALVGEFRRLNEFLQSVRFSPDGARLAVTSSARFVYLLDGATLGVLSQLEGHRLEIFAVAFDPGGARLVTGSNDGTAIVWDAGTGERQLTFDTGRPVFALAVSPDGRQIATGGEGEMVSLWDAATGERRRDLFGHTGGVHQVAFDPGGARLLSASDDGTAKVWDAATGRHLLTLSGHRRTVYDALFTPDGARVVTASADGTVRLWDAPPGHGGKIAAVAYSADGRLVASAGGDEQDRTVRLWDGATGEELRVFRGHRAGLRGVALAPDGARLATAGADGAVKIWDAESGRELLSFDEHDGEALVVAFSPDGQLVASGGRDPRVLIWEARSGRVVRRITVLERTVSLAFSPDGRWLAIGGHDAVGVRVYPVERGPGGQELRGHLGPVWDVAFSPDGARLATAGEDQTVRVWDVAAGRLERTLESPDGAVRAVAYSPDGTVLAAATRRGTIILWEAATGRRVGLFTQPAPIEDLAYRPDGRALVAATEGRPLTFLLDTAELIAAARSRVTRP